VLQQLHTQKENGGEQRKARSSKTDPNLSVYGYESVLSWGVVADS
jgi:hypothetical protein